MIFYIYIYSFSRRFYTKRLTIEKYNKRYIIKRQTVTGSACKTTCRHCSEQKELDRERLRKENKGFFYEEEAEVN